MNQRQSLRRVEFQIALESMPMWEVWGSIYKVDTGFLSLSGERILVDVKKDNFKLIPRRLRRQMARTRVYNQRHPSMLRKQGYNLNVGSGE